MVCTPQCETVLFIFFMNPEGGPVTRRIDVDASKILFKISERKIQLGNLGVICKRSRQDSWDWQGM
jgi:hypothetical protein